MTIPLRTIYELNPLVTLRRVVPGHPLRPRGSPDRRSSCTSTAWAAVLLGFGLWVFGKLERRLAEEAVSPEHSAIVVKHVGEDAFGSTTSGTSRSKASVMRRHRRASTTSSGRSQNISFEVPKWYHVRRSSARTDPGRARC